MHLDSELVHSNCAAGAKETLELTIEIPLKEKDNNESYLIPTYEGENLRVRYFIKATTKHKGITEKFAVGHYITIPIMITPAFVNKV